ncbi:enkurin [Labrus mixtus]|uniref:enkurin n=1 Tax=Labrus mixtus TaxID=508554 RepID=UPI0029BFD25F|nr:enkurin [Labrus mixtus]
MSGFIYPPESVYNLLPKEEVHTQRPPRYMSKFRPAVILEKRSIKGAMKTMGPAKVEVPPPDKYLKKHSNDSKLPEITQCSKEGRNTCAVRKPPVPARTDQPLMGFHTKRDFIKTASAVPMKPRPACVDTIKGHKQPLEKSGLLPEYIKKKDYGEVPEYLKQRIEEEQRAHEENLRFLKDQREQGAIRQLSEEERQSLIEGLKQNWDQLHHDYQGLSLVTDTMKKKAHKQRLEDSMKQLETDMKSLERFKTIYIPKN